MRTLTATVGFCCTCTDGCFSKDARAKKANANSLAPDMLRGTGVSSRGLSFLGHGACLTSDVGVSDTSVYLILFGVLIIRVLLFNIRVPYFRKLPCRVNLTAGRQLGL